MGEVLFTIDHAIIIPQNPQYKEILQRACILRLITI